MSLSLHELPVADHPHPARPRRRLGRALVEVLLTLGALAGLAVTAVTFTAARNGYQPLVVRSGSMEPTIATGSLVLMQRVGASEIEVGDIVAVERPDRTRVTHRVVSLVPRGSTVELTLKGDANEDPDPVPVTVAHADRLVLQVPQVGRAMGWLATAQGGFVLGCLATLATSTALRGRSTRRAARSQREQRHRDRA